MIRIFWKSKTWTIEEVGRWEDSENCDLNSDEDVGGGLIAGTQRLGGELGSFLFWNLTFFSLLMHHLFIFKCRALLVSGFDKFKNFFSYNINKFVSNIFNL